MNNIVLIGFKNSGKTSVGKALAKKLNRSFIDTDYLIEEKYYEETHKKLKTCDIYKMHGEQYFRDLESAAIKNLDQFNNSIISTGGGCVLREENMLNLKKNAKIIYLETSINELKKRANTKLVPAFLDDENVEKSFMAVYEQRKPLYSRYADFVLETDEININDIAEDIIVLLS